MLVYGRDEELAAIAGYHLGIKAWGPCRAIGVARGNTLLGVVVYNQYRHPNIEASIWSASPRWATPEALRGLLRYPFHQLGCKRITATSEATNQRARAFLCRLGFTLEGYHPDALPTGDAVSYGLLRKNAERWIAED